MSTILQEMKNQIEEIRTDIQTQLKNVTTFADVEKLKVEFLGKKGRIQQLMRYVKEASSDERPEVGRIINELKNEVTEQSETEGNRLRATEQEARLSSENIDVTLPGRQRFQGRQHLLTQVMQQVLDVLTEMGFTIQVGPDIESDYYNFEALNFPKDHPARDMQDTFYITDDLLLRTQMTDLQVRVMEDHKPPIRVVAPGRCYRNEEVTSRSHVFFHQVDVFYIDEGVTFADLLATKEKFIKKMFPGKVEWRFRPSYFPFVEPGMETDISCLVCGGKGCSVCKHTGWLEISGSGMVHPEVLKNGGIDPEKYTGFAWGMGLERLVMLMYGISDIRTFTENDLRFLQQF